MEITCFGTFLTHDEFTGSSSLESEPVGSLRPSDPEKMRRGMSMNRLISAAHAAGYAMAAEEVAEPRTIVARVPQSTAVVVHPVHRGVVANAQRSVRRMWLQFFADHWGHRAAA